MALLSVHPQLLFSMPSGGEWLWVILAIIILFGGKKIPELARGLGKGIREFNDAKEGVKSEIEAGMKDKEKAA
jgi:sec-independent protein translocase protein TatA